MNSGGVANARRKQTLAGARVREESEWWRGRGCAKKANRGGVAVARMRGIKRTVTERVGQWRGRGCTKKTNVGGGAVREKSEWWRGRGCAKKANRGGVAVARMRGIKQTVTGRVGQWRGREVRDSKQTEAGSRVREDSDWSLGRGCAVSSER